MSIQNHSMTVQRTAHYSTFGTLDKKKTKYIWIAMHGYGQLSSRMINKFNFLDPEEHFVIAPEGLNRFYWNGKGDRYPVATWMTSMYRYDEIHDYTNYLQSIYDRYCKHVNHNVRIIFLGFSQGCATMWRWIHSNQPRYHIAINWAGWIPEDISYGHLRDFLSDKKNHILYGDEDHLLTEKNLEGIKKIISENGLQVDFHEFKGGHKIIREELEKFTYREVMLKDQLEV